VYFRLSSCVASQSQLWINKFKDSKFVQAERDISGVSPGKAEERAALKDGVDRLGTRTRAPTAGECLPQVALPLLSFQHFLPF